MGLIPKIKCRRCGAEYAAARKRCPRCGAPAKAAPRKKPESAAPAGAETARETVREPEATRSPAQRRAAAQAAKAARVQMIVGGVILVAIIAAVIVLISMNVGENANLPSNPDPVVTTNITPTMPETAQTTPTPEPTQEPENSPEPTASQVESIKFTINGMDLAFENQFTMNAGESLTLEATVSPADPEAKIQWSVDDESILTVDDTGLVTGVSSGWATVTATCDGVSAQCKVWVS